MSLRKDTNEEKAHKTKADLEYKEDAMSDYKKKIENFKDKYLKIIAYLVVIYLAANSALGTAAAQVLHGYIPHFELNAWIFLCTFLIVLPFVLNSKCDVHVPKDKILLVAIFIFLMNAINVTSFTIPLYLPLGITGAMKSAFKIIMNAVLSICIISDRRIPLYAAAVFSTVGLIFICQPDFIFNEAPIAPGNWTPPCQSNSTLEDFTDEEGVMGAALIGYILIVANGICAVSAFHVLRRLKDISIITLGFWIGLLGTVLSGILMAIFETPVLPTEPFCIFLLLLQAITACQHSLLFQWVMRHLSPSVVVLLLTNEIVLLLVFQYTILRDIQPSHENVIEIVGLVVCVLGVVVAPFWDLYNSVQEKENEKEDNENTILNKKQRSHGADVPCIHCWSSFSLCNDDNEDDEDAYEELVETDNKDKGTSIQ